MTMELHKILQKLPGQDWWNRQRVIAGLKAYPEKEYIEYLEDGIRNHEDADIRNTAMEVYRALGAGAFPSLAALLKDADPEVRLFSVNILCEIGDKGAVQLLLSSIRDNDINVRAASAEALGRMGDAGAIGALQEALKDEPWVAMAAVNSIGDIGGEDALDLLYTCLDKEGYEGMTINAIERAGNRESIRYLTACFENSDLRELALKAIVKIAEKERIRPQPEYFIRLVPLLVEMLGLPDLEMKKYAFMALCWSKDISVIPYLFEALKDEELQEYAIEGLLSIGRIAVCSIVDELKGSAGGHRVILAKVLDMIGEDKALLQFADDQDPEVRTEAALALGALDMERAVRTLASMLSDPHEEVRAAARKSLAGLKKNG